MLVLLQTALLVWVCVTGASAVALALVIGVQTAARALPDRGRRVPRPLQAEVTPRRPVRAG